MEIYIKGENIMKTLKLMVKMKVDEKRGIQIAKRQIVEGMTPKDIITIAEMIKKEAHEKISKKFSREVK